MKIFDAKTASPQSAGGIARAEILPAGKREEIASKGGKRRAKVLSKEQREAIASKGGAAKNKGA